MKGDSKELLKFLEGSDKRFVIPVYQRNYDWKLENCQQLLSDLCDVANEGRDSHFFGSIVASTDGDDRIIIDGQQRITTVSLLLLALVRLIEQDLISYESEILSEKINNEYLIDKYKPEEKKIKLKPVKNDLKAFKALFTGEEDYLLESNVTQNYLFFFENLKTLGVSADAIFEAIKKLVVIDIALENSDDPQLIFESLNSTGLDLSEADKIRNYILMGLDQSLQEKMYENYWNKIEEYTNYQVSDFVRQYLTLKLGAWPKQSNVYPAFKSYVIKNELEVESLLADMLDYARLYSQIISSKTSSGDANIILKRLALLETTVIYPFLFALFKKYSNNEITEENLCRMLLAIESYIFRRIVCESPTNALNKVFASLNNEALKKIDEDSDYADAAIYSLLKKSGTTKFPDDSEFEDSVRTRDFYNTRSKNKIYYFTRLINGDSYEILDVESAMNSEQNSLSVEHIMPRTLSETWKNELGNEYEAIHETWVNRIANLTLTAYNSKYSNRSFKDKLTIENGFRESPLPINKWIGQQDKWTKKELMARSDMMAEKFLELWPLPASEFKPKEDENDEYTLAEQYDFKGTDVLAYTLMGEKHSVQSWKEATEEVLLQINELEPATFYALAKKDDFPYNYLAIFDNDEPGWTKISNKIYAYLATSTNVKMRLLEAVFASVGLSGDELSFEIRGEE